MLAMAAGMASCGVDITRVRPASSYRKFEKPVQSDEDKQRMLNKAEEKRNRKKQLKEQRHAK